MHTIIASLAFALLFFQSSSREKKTDRDYDHLHGPVRIARIEMEDLQDQPGKPKTGARFLIQIVKYDTSGRETEDVTFNNLGGACAFMRNIFSYDAQNNRTVALYWGESIIKGDKSGASQTPASPIILRKVFKLDDSGRRSEVDDYDSAERLYQKTRYIYDDKGLVKETIITDSDSRRSQCSFKYNDKGLPSEQTCQYSVPGLFDKTEYAYEYDSNDNWIKKTATISATLPNGSPRARKQIFYREIKYYSPQNQADQEGQKEAADMFDGTKLVPCEAMVIRKSGGVLQGSATRRVEPRYPSAARDARIVGQVVIEVLVNESGKV